MKTSKQLSRRTFLRGLGVSIALPWLEVMGPLTSWANAPREWGSTPDGSKSDGIPLRTQRKDYGGLDPTADRH